MRPSNSSVIHFLNWTRSSQGFETKDFSQHTSFVKVFQVGPTGRGGWELYKENNLIEEEATLSIEEGEYNLENTVDLNGIEYTDELEIALGEIGICEYTNEEDKIETDGLRDTIDDWRNEDIETKMLRDAIDYWRNEEAVDEC